LIPGPDFDAYAAAALDGASPGTARRDLGELYDQHLLAEHAPGRYRLHDLLRQHARALAAADDDAETDAAAGRLLGYYLHTALAAGQHFPRRCVGTGRRPLPGHPPPPLALPAVAAPGPARRPGRPPRGRAPGWGRRGHAAPPPGPAPPPAHPPLPPPRYPPR